MTKISLELELKQLAQAILNLPKNERQQLPSLLATLEEEQDPESIEARKEAEEDMREGRVFTFEEVFGVSQK